MLTRIRRFKKKYSLLLFLIICCTFLVYLTVLHLANVLMTKYGNSSKYAQRPLRGRGAGPTVVVAHYIGSGNLFGNFSKDLLNQNFYSPVPGEGENGKPVVIPARDILKMQHLFQINRFNLLASDKIPLNRSLPDVRKKKCQSMNYFPTALPTTSVIIVFHNEAWSVLLRTVWSVINRSPSHLLKEILLVDDSSTREFLKSPLDDYVASLPVHTVVLRQLHREGLVPARLMGARYATGEILTFLDAHCECTIGWLEPLLARVKENPKKVVCPVIDIVSDDNFGYVKSFEVHWGAFNWQLHFRWYLLGEKELNKRKINIIEPFFTPAMAGGLFSINKKYFFDIGAYDTSMKIWGGDNLEMSFRIWQCGGEIEIIPCSHVGHLFRKSSPYTFPGGVNEILNENLARTALVWMDEWSNFFFKYNNIEKSNVEKLDVSDRVQLRTNLKCHSFDWYLRNVWTEHFFPASDRFFGKLILVDTDSKLYHEYLDVLSAFDMGQNLDWAVIIPYLNKQLDRLHSIGDMQKIDGLCVQKPQSQGVLSLPYGQGSLKPCRRSDANMDEMFVIKSSGHIMTNEGICLDSLLNEANSDRNVSMVRIVPCARTTRQKWFYNIKTQQIVQNMSDFCLTGQRNEPQQNQQPTSSLNITMSPCNASKMQKWMLLPLQWT